MRFRTSFMFLAYSFDWLTISSEVNVGRCFTETSAVPGAAPPAEGGAIGAGAGPCANTVLARRVLINTAFTFTTAPFPFTQLRLLFQSGGPRRILRKSGSYKLGRNYIQRLPVCQHGDGSAESNDFFRWLNS